ncbi:MAG: C40 family peptidase [Kineosporiaceae bacterium]|nr:C40 family peptidase [Kineosporiaceae bacterium]
MTAAAVAATTIAVAITGVGGAVAVPQPDVATVRRQVTELRHQAEEATEQYNGTREKLASVSVMISAAQTRVKQQQAQVEVARQGLGRLAAETYKAGDLEMVSLLLSDDPDAVLAATGLRETLGERRAQAVAALVAAERRLTQDQENLEAQKRELTTESARLKKLREQIDDKLDAAEALYNRLDAAQRAAYRRIGSTMDREDLESVGVDVPASGTLKCANVGIETASAKARIAIDHACDQLGKPYRWGGSGPGSYDCSGLTMAAWSKAGVSLPHNAAMQAREGTTVSQANLQPGDLLFFNNYNHTGIYLGKGLMIHAPQTGDVIKIASARLDGRLIKAVRL